NLLSDLRQFGESYRRTADHIRQQNPIIQKGHWVQLGAEVSHARKSLLRIPGLGELRTFAMATWGEDITLPVCRRILGTLVQRSNGKLSVAEAENIPLAEAASRLIPSPDPNELPAPTDKETRRRVIDALENWKRVIYAPPDGKPTLEEHVKLTNAIVAWRDRYAPHFDVTPLAWMPTEGKLANKSACQESYSSVKSGRSLA